MHGETYGCVKSFCYLEDTLDGKGGMGLAATARIRNDVLLRFLTVRAPLLKMKGRVYASCDRRSMTYRSETKPLLADVALKFEREDDRWTCCVSMKDRRKSEELKNWMELSLSQLSLGW